MPVVLAPLLILADALVTLAMAALATYIVIGIFKLLEAALGSVPILGPFLNSAARSVAQELTNLLGTFERGIDKAIGASWHLLAESADWVWRETKHQAEAILQASTLVAALAAAYQLIHRELRDLTKGLGDLPHNIGARLRALEHGIEADAKSISGLQHIVNKDVLPEIRSLDRELTQVETQTIPAIRSIANTAENDVTALRKWVTLNFPAIGTEAFAGAVAIALAALGLSGLRCSSLLNSLRNRGCGLWQGLEDLLGLFIDTLILADLCAILPETVAFFGVVEAPLTGLISQAANAVCSVSNPNWTTVNVAPGPQPTAQAFAANSLPPNV